MLLKGDKVKLDADDEASVVRTLGRTMHSAPIAEGYATDGRHEATHRTMMILKHFDPRVYRLIVGDFVKYLGTWTPDYQHSAWLITGSRWQPGLIKVADGLGSSAAPLMAELRKCLDSRIDKASKNRAVVECRDALRKALEAYDAKRGR